MIYLVTGTPGSGKTLFVVSKILELKKQYPERKIFSDIEELNIDEVEKSPEDWRTCPDNSIVIYDEAQQHERFRAGTAANKDEIVQALQVHRHRGFDVWFITQSPRFLNNFVIDLVGEHFHLHRPFGAKLATVYYWRSAQKQPQSQAAQQRTENQFLFKYPKDLFNYYKSATQHNVKLRLPRSLFIILFALLFLIVFVYKMATGSGTQKMIKGELGKAAPTAPALVTAAPASAPAPSVPAPSAPVLVTAAPASAPAPAVPAPSVPAPSVPAPPVAASITVAPTVIAGVIAINGDCRAFDQRGNYVEMSLKKCLDYSKHSYKLRVS